MSFRYIPKPFKDDKDEEEDEVDDDDDEDLFDKKKGAKRKGHEVKKETSSKKKKVEDISTAKFLDNEVQSDDDVIVERRVAAKRTVDLLLAKKIADEDDKAVIQIKDDESTNHRIGDNNPEEFDYKGFLSKSTTKVQGLGKKNGISDSNSKYVSTQKTTTDSALVLPTVRVRTAAERAFASNSSKTINDLSDEGLLQKFIPSFQAAATEIKLASKVNRMKILTRLLKEAPSNHKHEKNFIIAATDNFVKLREGLSKAYGIDVAGIIMMFDGFKLTDDQTAEEVELEVDSMNMIDVHIPKGKFDAAVIFATNAIDRKAAETILPTSSSSDAIPDPGEVLGAHEEIMIHMYAAKEFTTNSKEADFEVKVLKSDTLQSLHNMLQKESSLKIQGVASYCRSSKPAEDLDMAMSFSELDLKDPLVIRFKSIYVKFDLSSFIDPSTQKNITEPIDIKVRLDTKFSRAMVSISKKLGCSLENLDCKFNTFDLDSLSDSTFLKLGILVDSQISVSRK